MKYFTLLFVLTSCSTTQLLTLNNSIHYDADDRYNQNHKGLGIRAEIKDGLYVGLIHYTNSYDEKSRMVIMDQETEIYDNVYIGPVIGIADGYDDYMYLGGFAVRYGMFRILLTPTVVVSGLVIGFE